MNKADLIEALAPRVGGRAVATTAVESLVDLVLREVATGGSVVITGFGTFETVDRAARTGRNPRTGEAVPISATSSPRFRPAAYFKDVVGDPDRLPKEGLAGARVGSDGAAPPRGGAPSTVRRPAAPAKGAAGAGARTSSGREPAAGRARPTTGTPSTVRAAPAEPQAETAAPAPAPQSGGLVTGGEEITLGVINAKKAELARVKSDEVARADRSRRDSESSSATTDKKNGKKKGKKGGKKGKGGGGKKARSGKGGQQKG